MAILKFWGEKVAVLDYEVLKMVLIQKYKYKNKTKNCHESSADVNKGPLD